MVYLPKHFAETRAELLADFMHRHPFATLVTSGADGTIASHIPLLFDPTRGTHGTLVGHLARPNPQAQHLRDHGHALAIFHGPHAYVSPRWYKSGPAVPTWNFAAIHAQGPGRATDDPVRLAAIVDALSRVYEASAETPWTFDGLPENYARGMLKGIVGFEIDVTVLQGKFKLSQNRSADDRAGVVAALEAGTPDDRALADLMIEHDPDRLPASSG